MGNNFCSNCGAKTNADDVFCEECGYKLKQTDTSLKKKSNGFLDFLGVIGFLMICAGALILIGSLIAVLMQGPMETTGKHRVWAIGAVIYEIFYPTGWIEHSFADGTFSLVVGFILALIGK